MNLSYLHHLARVHEYTEFENIIRSSKLNQLSTVDYGTDIIVEFKEVQK